MELFSDVTNPLNESIQTLRNQVVRDSIINSIQKNYASEGEDMFDQNKIKQLYSENVELRNSNDELSNSNGELKSLLNRASNIIAHQKTTISDLSAPSYRLGLLLSILPPPDLMIGDSVQISEHSRYRIQGYHDNKKMVGVVVNLAPDSDYTDLGEYDHHHHRYDPPLRVQVMWSNDTKNTYAYSIIHRDLVFLQKNEEDEMIPIHNQAYVLVGQEKLIYNIPQKFQNDAELKVGDRVLITQSNNILRDITMPDNYTAGVIAKIKHIIKSSPTEDDDNYKIQVDFGGEIRQVLYSAHLDAEEFKENDTVLLDDTATIIIQHSSEPENKHKVQNDDLKIRFNDIGGLEEAKQILKETFIVSHKHQMLYEKYNKKPIKGIALYGPPGCGKTMLGKAIYTELSQLYGESASSTGFIYIKGPELLNKYVGNTEASIQELFDSARQHYEMYNYPAVLFIDEADGLLTKRGSENNHGLSQTIVPMFLAEMDGLEESHTIVVLSTNRIDTLDPAILREGRIDVKIKITRPNKQATKEILKIYLESSNLSIDSDRLVESAIDDIFDENKTLYHIKTKQGDKILRYSDIISGATLYSIVDRAITIAINRDIEKNTESHLLSSLNVSGINDDDIKRAIQESYKQQLHLNHEENIAYFLSDISHTDILHIERMLPHV